MPKRYPTVEEKRAHCLGRMLEGEANIGPQVRFRPVANVMAAGPCAGCLAIAEKTYPARNAPLMPLDDCPHPDQCVGHYRIDPDSIW